MGDSAVIVAGVAVGVASHVAGIAAVVSVLVDGVAVIAAGAGDILAGPTVIVAGGSCECHQVQACVAGIAPRVSLLLSLSLSLLEWQCESPCVAQLVHRVAMPTRSLSLLPLLLVQLLLRLSSCCVSWCS